MNTSSINTIDALEATKDTWKNMTFGGLIYSLRISDEISQVKLAKQIGIFK